MLKIILLTLAAAIVIFVIVAAMQPAEFRVSRSALIAAPATKVFAQVNELRKWEAWNPWGKLDPAMKLAYDGPPAGNGASYHWVGNNQVGEGRLTIVESRASEYIRLKLEFTKPFTATNTGEFTFRPEGGGTTVTWSMNGHKNFIAKAMHLFFDMDKMVGGQFAKGLADLKAVSEAAAGEKASSPGTSRIIASL
jgi:uncharacterized protein YndB with AHSA1/START domain